MYCFCPTVAAGNPLKCSRIFQANKRRSRAGLLPRSTWESHTGRSLRGVVPGPRGTHMPEPGEAPGTGIQVASLTYPLSALFVSFSDFQRPPFSLPGTVAPLQGPHFPLPCSLRPLRFCSTAQLPRTRLSLQGPQLPSGSLAACSLLLQVVFIGLSLGVGVLSLFPWILPVAHVRPEQL